MSSSLIRVMEESVKNGREEKNDRRVTNMKISLRIYLFSTPYPLFQEGGLLFPSELQFGVMFHTIPSPYIQAPCARGRQ
jgi:hypothetical protein